MLLIHHIRWQPHLQQHCPRKWFERGRGLAVRNLVLLGFRILSVHDSFTNHLIYQQDLSCNLFASLLWSWNRYSSVVHLGNVPQVGG